MRANRDVVVHARVIEHASGADRAARADARLAEKLYTWLDQRVRSGRHFGIDHNGLGQINRYARVHQLGSLPRAKRAVHIGKMRARVATEDFLRVGSGLREHSLVALAQQADRIGEIELAVSVVRTQRGKAGPEFFEREAINAGIYLVNCALLGRRSLFFDDGLHAALGIANDAAIVRGIVEYGGENRRGGFASAVRVEQGGKRCGAQQRSVPRDDNHQFGALANRAPRNLDGVARSALRLLKNRLRAEPFDYGGNIFSLMAHDDEQLRRLEQPAGAHHVLDKRASARAMQHLREVGAHAHSLTRGENDDGGITGSHRKTLSLPPEALAIKRRTWVVNAAALGFPGGLRGGGERDGKSRGRFGGGIAGFGPQRAVGKEARDKLRMQRVACFVRDDARLKRPSHERQVAD